MRSALALLVVLSGTAFAKDPVPPAAPVPKPSPMKMPDPAVIYSVPVDGEPAQGPASAKVTVVEFSDFACPHCRRVTPTLDELQRLYGSDLRLVWKNLIVYPRSTPAALATCAAHAQGKFWEMYNHLWKRVWDDQGMHTKDAEFSAASMAAAAAELRLDAARFKADYDGEACKRDLADDAALAKQLGARGAPAFFINGRYLSGNQPLENFKKIIDEEKVKADAAVKSGQRPEDIYPAIVSSGKKVND
jgi:protein-disulfide isomerase